MTDLERLIEEWLLDPRTARDKLPFNEWCELQPALADRMIDCGCCGGTHLDMAEYDCRAFYPRRPAKGA